MLISRGLRLLAGKIWTVLLIGVVSTALMIPLGDVALGQSSTVTISTTFDYPGAMETDAIGINGPGQIVGYFISSNNSAGASCTANPIPAGCVHGFLRSAGGSFATIDLPNSAFTQAFGINDAGQIVGTYSDASSRIHAFVRDPTSGIFTTLDDPNGVNTVAFGINGTGQIVGYFQNNNGTHGFVRDPTSGMFSTFDDPNGVVNGVGHTFGYGTSQTTPRLTLPFPG
jgi:probable HAF family extracellular repeat protein